MLIFISFLFAFLVYTLPARCVSTVQFFSDKDCQNSIGNVNGTDDGACHPAIATDASAKLISLDPHCAATIYSDPFCSNSATIANLNTCMSGSVIVGSFSIDCQAATPSPAGFTVASGQPTSSSTPSAATTSGQKVSPSQSSLNLSPTLLAAIISGAGGVIALASLGFAFWRCHRRRGQRRQAFFPTGKMGEKRDADSLKGHISAPRVTEPAFERQEHWSATTIPFFMAVSKPPSRAPSKTSMRVPSRAPNVSSPPGGDINPLVSPLTPAPAHVGENQARIGTPPSSIRERNTMPLVPRTTSGGGAWWRRAQDIQDSQVRRQDTLTLFPPKSPYDRKI